MKSFAVAAAALGLFAQSNAFPALMTDPNSPLVQEAMAKGLLSRDNIEALVKRQDQGVGAPEVAPIFNASEQYVSNQGQYKYVAPGPTDARGPCPGLNAMANHGKFQLGPSTKYCQELIFFLQATCPTTDLLRLISSSHKPERCSVWV